MKSWRTRSLTGWWVREQHTHFHNISWPNNLHPGEPAQASWPFPTIWQLSLVLPLVAMCRLLQPKGRKGHEKEVALPEILPGVRRQASNSSVPCLTCNAHMCTHRYIKKGKSGWVESWEKAALTWAQLTIPGLNLDTTDYRDSTQGWRAFSPGTVYTTTITPARTQDHLLPFTWMVSHWAKSSKQLDMEGLLRKMCAHVTTWSSKVSLWRYLGTKCQVKSWILLTEGTPGVGHSVSSPQSIHMKRDP